MKSAKRQTFEKKSYFHLKQQIEYFILDISDDVNLDLNLDDSDLSFTEAEIRRLI